MNLTAAEKWLEARGWNPQTGPEHTTGLTFIRQIQADALRAAAEHMEHYSDDQGCDHCEVLVMADNLCPSATKPKV